MKYPIHTSPPWDAKGTCVLYSAPDEAHAISMIEIRANVTESGWDTIAFIEAIWPNARANARVIAAAPDLLRALEDLLGDRPSLQHGECIHCGRQYPGDIESGDCPSDDCPSYNARAAIRSAKGGAV